MAVRRARHPKPLTRLRAGHVARVRRTAEKVKRGRMRIEDVEADVREFVRDKIAGRPDRPGRVK